MIWAGGIPIPAPLDKKIHSLGHYVLSPNDAEEADVVIFGVPYDGNLPPQWMASSRLGPQALRSQLAMFRGYSRELDVDIPSVLRLVDIGDVDVVFDTPEVLRRTADVVGQIVKRHQVPFMLGGDHTNTIGVIQGFNKETDTNLGLIYFDAHLDLTDSQYDNPYYDGCVFRRILELGCVKPENLVCIGPRGYVNPAAGWEYADEAGVRVFSIEDVDEQGIVAVTKQAIQAAQDGTSGVYLSVDLDGLDSTATLGQAWPMAGGLTLRELLKSVRMIASSGIVGFDVVELAPASDHQSITAIHAASIGMEILGGLAKSRVSQFKEDSSSSHS